MLLPITRVQTRLFQQSLVPPWNTCSSKANGQNNDTHDLVTEHTRQETGCLLVNNGTPSGVNAYQDGYKITPQTPFRETNGTAQKPPVTELGVPGHDRLPSYYPPSQGGINGPAIDAPTPNPIDPHRGPNQTDHLSVTEAKSLELGNKPTIVSTD